MGNFFGTDGIRGIANQALTCELALKIGKAAAYALTGNCSNAPKIIIGKDTRISSDMLESALMAGICSVGAKSIALGVIPTPAIAYLVKKYEADAGIMISASHNSFEFNGIKIFDKNGNKLPRYLEEKIESLILSGSEEFGALPCGEDIGNITYYKNAARDYINHLKSTIDLDIKGIKIAVDCANGAASSTAETLFSELGADVNIIFNSPNGININADCGSTATGNLAEYVVANKCDIGIAFDGDADRCICIDENGEIIDGDAIVAICTYYMKKENKLKNNTVVGTIMSSFGLKKFCEKNQLNFSETLVGDKYVLEKMLEKGYNIGGEPSGHIIFLDYASTGDGQLTALQMLKILAKSRKKASELHNLIPKFPQSLITVNIKQSQKGILAKNQNINKELAKMQSTLGTEGKILVRESGTEPKIRIMIECNDKEKLKNLSEITKNLIIENLK